LVIATGIARAEEQVTLDRVTFITGTKWYVMRDNTAPKGVNVLYFRKYALPVIDGNLDVDRIKNLVNFACQKNGKLWDHVVVYFPKWVDLQTIDERSWLPEMRLRISIDRSTLKTGGEYKAKELYIDVTDANRQSMLELLTSSEVVIEFGPAQERIEIRQVARDGTADVEGFFDSVVPRISTETGGGAVRGYDTASMLRTCVEYRKTGRFWSERR
jgi:hypothetical protein